LKAEGDWEVLQKYSGSNLMIMLQSVARTGYENILYLERPGCNFIWVTKKKQPKEIRQPLRVFQGRVVEDSEGKKGESLLSSTPVVVLLYHFRRTPTIEEYKAAVKGINLTQFAPLTNYWQISKIVNKYLKA
jgi:aconitate hydratase 2/2-methylisocitrate dehydratase